MSLWAAGLWAEDLWAPGLWATDAPPSAPTINTQPQPASVVEGETAQFTVSATTSGGTLLYQWQVQALGAGAWGNVSTGSGGTTNTYTTAATTISGGNANNTDLFRVNVTDDNGTTTSGTALLTVTEPASGSTSNWSLRIRRFITAIDGD